MSVLAVRRQFLLIKTVCWPFLLNKTVSWPLQFNITVHWPFLFHGTASDSKERTGNSPVPVLDDMNGTAKTNGTVTVEIKNRPYLVGPRSCRKQLVRELFFRVKPLTAWKCRPLCWRWPSAEFLRSSGAGSMAPGSHLPSGSWSREFQRVESEAW